MQTAAPAATRCVEAHAALADAYLQRALFTPADQQAAAAAKLAERGYEAAALQCDADAAARLRSARSQALLVRIECALHAYRPRDAAQLAATAAAADRNLRSEGSVLRAPLLLLSARAALLCAQRTATKAARLLALPDHLVTATPSLSAMVAAAAAPHHQTQPSQPTPSTAAAASGWHLHEWVHDGVPYLVDTAALRVLVAPIPPSNSSVVASPLEPVGRLLPQGDVRWLAERPCPLDAVAAAGWEPLEHAWAQLASWDADEPEGTLHPSQLPQLLALLVRGCTAADKTHFGWLLSLGVEPLEQNMSLRQVSRVCCVELKCACRYPW